MEFLFLFGIVFAVLFWADVFKDEKKGKERKSKAFLLQIYLLRAFAIAILIMILYVVLVVTGKLRTPLW